MICSHFRCIFLVHWPGSDWLLFHAWMSTRDQGTHVGGNRDSVQQATLHLWHTWWRKCTLHQGKRGQPYLRWGHLWWGVDLWALFPVNSGSVGVKLQVMFSVECGSSWHCRYSSLLLRTFLTKWDQLFCVLYIVGPFSLSFWWTVGRLEQ